LDKIDLLANDEDDFKTAKDKSDKETKKELDPSVKDPNPRCKKPA